MAEQWISAAQARAIATTKYGLCERAHAGLLRTKAAFVVFGDTSRNDIELNKNFWWAEGHDALEQNWHTGDFSTWLKQKVHVQAFGVTFALSDVLDMVAPDQRSTWARQLSVVGKPEWMAARHARAHVVERVGADEAAAATWIIAQAALGFVSACAVEASAEGVEKDEKAFDWHCREWPVPSWFWSSFASSQTAETDWAGGRFDATGEGPKGERRVTLSAVYFERAALTAMTDAEAAPTPPDPATPNTGGRPRAAFAEDMLNAVWGRIYDGSLMPAKQADIQNAMLEWLAANGQSLSESTVKDRARKLWQIVKPGAET